MAQERITRDKLVEVTYSILDEKGEEILEASDLPISYVQGRNSGIFPAIERKLEGKGTGSTVWVTLPPREGFGDWDPELTFTDDIDNVPPQFRHVGAEVKMQNERGEEKTFVVTKIDNGRLTVDGNHPFAGKTVQFRVDVVAVRDATPEEKMQGRPAQSWESTVN